MRNLDWTTATAEKAGESIGLDWDTVDFTPEDLLVGMNVELEHCADADTNVISCEPEATAKIAWAHLKESATYYRVLAKMEQSFKKADVRTAAGEEAFDTPAKIDVNKVYQPTPSTTKALPQSKTTEPLAQRAEEILKAQGKTTWTDDEYAAAYQQAKQETIKSWSVPEKVKRDVEQIKLKTTPDKLVEAPSPAQQRVLDSLKAKGVDTPTKQQFTNEARELKKLTPKVPKPKKVKVKSVKEEALALLKARKINDPTPEEWLAAQNEVKAAKKEKSTTEYAEWLSKATQDIEAENAYTKSLDAELDPDEARGLQSVRATASNLLPLLMDKLAALTKAPKVKSWFPHPDMPHQVCTVLDVLVRSPSSKYARNVAALLDIPVGVVALATTPVSAQNTDYFTTLDQQFDSGDYSTYLDLLSDALSSSSELKTFNLKSIPWELELYDSTDGVMNAGGLALPDVPAGLSVLAVANQGDIKYLTKTEVSTERTPRTVLSPGKWPDFATSAKKWYDVSDFTGEPSKAVVMSIPAPYQKHEEDTELLYTEAAAKFLGFSRNEKETFVNYHLLRPGDAKYDEAEEVVDDRMESINDKLTAGLEAQGYRDWTAVVIDSTKDKRIPGLPLGLVVLGIVPDEVLSQYKAATAQRKFIVEHAVQEGKALLKALGPNVKRGTDIDKIVLDNQAELGLDDDEAQLWRQYFTYGLGITKPVSSAPAEKPMKLMTDVSELPARGAAVKTQDSNAYFKVNPLHFTTQTEIQDYYSPDFLREVYGFYDADQAQQAQAKVTAIWKMRKAAVGAKLTYTEQRGDEIVFRGSVDGRYEYDGLATIADGAAVVTKLNPWKDYAHERIVHDTPLFADAVSAWHATKFKSAAAAKGTNMRYQVKASALLKIAELLGPDADSTDKQAIKLAGDVWLNSLVGPRTRKAGNVEARVDIQDNLKALTALVSQLADADDPKSTNMFVKVINGINKALMRGQTQDDAEAFKAWGVLKPQLIALVRGQMAEVEAGGPPELEAYAGKLAEELKAVDAKMEEIKSAGKPAPVKPSTAAVKSKTALLSSAPAELSSLDKIMGKLDAIEATVADLSATPTEGATLQLYNLSAALTRALASTNVHFDMRYATVKRHASPEGELVATIFKTLEAIQNNVDNVLGVEKLTEINQQLAAVAKIVAAQA